MKKTELLNHLAANGEERLLLGRAMDQAERAEHGKIGFTNCAVKPLPLGMGI